jgi:hypothetical protein
MKFNPKAKSSPYISVEVAEKPRTVKEPIVRRSQAESEYDLTTALHCVKPWSELSCLLGLLHTPGMFGMGMFSDGNSEWSDVKGGWKNSRTGSFLSFDDARKMIADRIKELGLDTDLVNDYINGSLDSRQETWQQQQAFWSLPFEQRMNKFRVAA